MKYKALFFDFDGTIVDTHESNLLAYSRAICDVFPDQLFDRDLLYEEIVNGNNYKNFLPKIISNISVEDTEKISKRKSFWYKEFASKSKVNFFAVDFINKVKEKFDIPIVLVTTAKKENAWSIIEYHSLNNLFDISIFGDNISRLKPYPDIYFHALSEMNLKPNEVRAYEDSISGVRAAKSAEIDVEEVIWDQPLEVLM